MSLLLHEVHGCLELRESNTRGVRKMPTCLLCDKINKLLFFSTSGCCYLPSEHTPASLPEGRLGASWLPCVQGTSGGSRDASPAAVAKTCDTVRTCFVCYLCLDLLLPSESLEADPPHRAPSSSVDTVGRHSALDGCPGPCTPVCLYTRKCKIIKLCYNYSVASHSWSFGPGCRKVIV